MMLDTIFQHLGTVQYSMFEWLGFRELYLFKETTPYFLLAKTRVFCPKSAVLLFPNILGKNYNKLFVTDLLHGSAGGPTLF